MAKQTKPDAKFMPIGWLRALIAICGLLAVAEFIVPRYAYFPLEAMPLFFAIFGFLAFGALIAGSWLLGKIVTRAVDYYDTPEGDA